MPGNSNATTSDVRSLLENSMVSYFVFLHDSNGDLYQDDEVIGSIVFLDGVLNVSRFSVQQPDFDSDLVRWSQTSDRGYTSGNLYFAQGGSELRGVIAVGDNAETADLYHVVATAFPLGEYTIMPEAALGQEPGTRNLRIGFPRGRGFAARTSVFLDGQDVTEYTSLSLDRNGQPLLDLIGTDNRQINLTFEVRAGQPVTISGSVTSSQAESTGAQQNLTGTPDPTEETDGILVFADVTQPDLSAALMEQETIIDAETLALAELMSCITDDRELGDKTFHGIIDNMKWAMSRDTEQDDGLSRRVWLDRFFQATPPVIKDPERVKIIVEDENWFVQTMSVAVLGNNFATGDFPKSVVPHPLNVTQKDTFRRYLQSNVPGQSAYLNQQNRMWNFTLRRKSQRLFYYAEADAIIRKRNAGGARQKTWAERLFDYHTSETSLTRLMDDLTGGSDLQSSFAARKDKADQDLQEIRENVGQVRENVKNQPDNEPMRKLLDNVEAALKHAEYRSKNIEQEWNAAVNGRIAHIKNVANILAILEPEGALADVYMKTCGSILLTKTAGLTDLGEIDGFDIILPTYLEKFFNEILDGTTRPFGERDNEEIRRELKVCIEQEFKTAAALADRITKSINKAEEGHFLKRAEEAERTFATAYPGLTRIYRVSLAFAYTLTVVAVASKLWTVSKSGEKQEPWSFDRVIGYYSFAKFAKSSFRYFTAKFAGTVAKSSGPGFMSRLGNYLRDVGISIVEGARSLIDAANPAVQCVVGFLGKVIGSLYKRATAFAKGAVSAAISAFEAARDWMANSEFCQQLLAFAGKVWSAVRNGIMLICVIWSSYKEGLNLYKVWKSDRSSLELALASVQFVCGVASGIAGIVGVIYGSAVWSGIGAVFALGGVFTALLLAWKFPPDSPLQDVITRVLVPFASNAEREMSLVQKKESPTPALV